MSTLTTNNNQDSITARRLRKVIRARLRTPMPYKQVTNQAIPQDQAQPVTSQLWTRQALFHTLTRSYLPCKCKPTNVN